MIKKENFEMEFERKWVVYTSQSFAFLKKDTKWDYSVIIQKYPDKQTRVRREESLKDGVQYITTHKSEVRPGVNIEEGTIVEEVMPDFFPTLSKSPFISKDRHTLQVNSPKYPGVKNIVIDRLHLSTSVPVVTDKVVTVDKCEIKIIIEAEFFSEEAMQEFSTEKLKELLGDSGISKNKLKNISDVTSFKGFSMFDMAMILEPLREESRKRGKGE